jgi:magnesium-transporting ATPase (P-type)
LAPCLSRCVSLFTLLFSVATEDEQRTAFTLDTLADSTFVKATGISVLTLILATVFGPLQSILDTVNLTIQQWLITFALAATILLASEIWKGDRQANRRQWSARQNGGASRARASPRRS